MYLKSGWERDFQAKKGGRVGLTLGKRCAQKSGSENPIMDLQFWPSSFKGKINVALTSDS